MSGWITGHVQQVIRNVVSLGVHNSARRELLRRREAACAVVQGPPMSENEDFVEFMVEMRIRLVNGSDNHRGVLWIVCDGMEHARNLSRGNRVQAYKGRVEKSTHRL